MPGEIIATELPLRPTPAEGATTNGGNRSQDKLRHKHARSSYSDLSPLGSRNNSLTFRPAKRSMSSPDQTIAVINASGRQAASLIRNATAVGYRVRAQMRNRLGVIATEVSTNPNVTVVEGILYTRQPRSDKEKVDVTKNGTELSGSGIGVNTALIKELFKDCKLAFINTTFYGDEIEIGKVLADAAKEAGVQHFVYSSMPDHHSYNEAWPSLPLWAPKQQVEDYVASIGLPATFVYTGIYNNNFTSLPYPLFCMDLQDDGTFVWQAPFHPDAKLPWLDAEHDVGPAIIQIFKDGVQKWGQGKRIALAYELLTPVEACAAFEKGVGRKVKYVRGPIDIKVPIPAGYRDQLDALQKLFDYKNEDATKQPPYFGDRELEDDCPKTAWELWEGPRGLQEYAGEAFIVEEYANNRRWMYADTEEQQSYQSSVVGVVTDDNDDNDEDEDEGLVMKSSKPMRQEEDWLA